MHVVDIDDVDYVNTETEVEKKFFPSLSENVIIESTDSICILTI